MVLGGLRQVGDFIKVFIPLTVGNWCQVYDSAKAMTPVIIMAVMMKSVYSMGNSL